MNRGKRRIQVQSGLEMCRFFSPTPTDFSQNWKEFLPFKAVFNYLDKLPSDIHIMILLE